jgi:hypothetical protein
MPDSSWDQTGKASVLHVASDHLLIHIGLLHNVVLSDYQQRIKWNLQDYLRPSPRSHSVISSSFYLSDQISDLT